MDLIKFFKNQGYDLEHTTKMAGYQEDWDSWYKGNVSSFHNYSVYNGEKRVPQKRLSLQMAKKVSEDWANLLMNEKVEIVIEDKATGELVEEVFSQNDFQVMANKGVELSFAIGTGAFVLSLVDVAYDKDLDVADVTNSRINIEFVQGKKIFPLVYDESYVYECAFASRKVESGGTYVYISMHVRDESGTYIIKNFKLKETKGGQYTDVTAQAEGFLPEFNTGGKVAWFFIFRPNIVNNVEYDSPYGISVFANSVSTLKSIDTAYDSLNNEFILGRKRVFVSAEMLKVDPTTGESRLTFDPNDVVFYALPQDMEGKNFIQDANMDIRTDEHEKALYMHLNILSSKCGFGERHYKFENGSVATATQVVSENSTLFRTLKKHELVLEQLLKDLVHSVIHISTVLIGKSGDVNAEVSVQFDDSIIEDKSAERVRDMQEVSSGLMSKWEFRMKHYGEDEETAKANVPQAEKMDWGL